MATSSSTVQESVKGTSSNQEAPTYEIKGRTMSLEEWDLTVQVYRPVDTCQCHLGSKNGV